MTHKNEVIKDISHKTVGQVPVLQANQCLIGEILHGPSSPPGVIPEDLHILPQNKKQKQISTGKALLFNKGANEML